MAKTARVSKAIKWIKTADLQAMSSEELQVICCERNSRNHRLSVNADRALKILRERSGAAQWDGIPRKPPVLDEDEY